MNEHGNYWSRAARRRATRRGALRGAAFGAAGLGALYLAGCGDDDDDAAPPEGTATTATGSPSAVVTGQATPSITRGGKLQIAHPYPEGALTLDPHTQESDGSQRSIRFLYNNLLRYIEDKGPGEREMVGDLAESWERPDPLTATFKLRPNVKFHDLPPVNGRTMTAGDVVFSFERMKTDNPKFVMRSTFATIESITAVDQNTIRVKTPFPYAPLLHNIAFPWASIVAREVVEKGDIENKPVGTGPFLLEEYVRGATLKYKKHQNYFKSGLPYLDAIETPIMPDPSARIAAFRAGQTALEGIPAAQVDEVKRTNSDAKFSSAASVTGAVIRFNVEDPAFKDVRVRQAIKFATNVQDYIDVVSGGKGIRTAPMPASIKNWTLPETELPQFDLAKAKALMSAAGVSELKITSSATQPYSSIDLTEVTVSQLKKIGIDVKIDILDNAAWIDKSYRASGFSFSTYQDYAYSDPDRGLRDHYHSKGGNNNHKFSDAELDGMLDKQREMLDTKERQRLVLDIQRKLFDKSPRVWLHIPIGFTAIQPWLQNYHQYVYEAGNAYQQYEGFWIKKS